MSRYFLQISYFGKLYHGWQIQKNTQNTIQQILQEWLTKICKQDIFIQGCGRTDTGVHARKFFADFKADLTAEPPPYTNLLFKINRSIPKDIAVHAIIPVTEQTSARYSAIKRTYRYYIHQKIDPFLNDLSWFVYQELDLLLMQQAAQIVSETKNFKSFAKTRNNHKNFDCTISNCQWVQWEHRLILTLSANRFLRNMVRALTGTMIDVGTKKISLEDFKNIIATGERAKASFSAPAHGLFLEEIVYPNEIFI